MIVLDSSFLIGFHNQRDAHHAEALLDDQIDTSDIPEVKDRAGWVRVHEHPEHPLHRVLSRLLSIRLPEPDIALAQKLAATKACRTKLTSNRCCTKHSNARRP